MRLWQVLLFRLESNDLALIKRLACPIEV
ncbi:hypothetical protein BGLA2_1080025 [Burkholderia gladioli]|nr:hypothetical protein BGLA2_1080025 [Burkholderia gladioli]